MQSENSVPDYQKIISRVRNSRLINIILSSIGILICVAAVVLSLNTEYIFFAASCAVIAGIFLASIIFKSARDMKSAKVISGGAVFAALLGPEQHIRVKQYIMRRAQLFYFTAFAVIVLPEAAVFTTMYFLFENSVYLLFLGAGAIFCLICVLLAILYLLARLSVADMMVLVSGNGILAGDEVISFNTQKKEVLQLLRFKDYYYLKFVKTSILGIKNISEIIFPIDGALRKGLTGEQDKELAVALELDNVFVTEDEFYESKNYFDSGVVDDEVGLPAPTQKKSGKNDAGGKKTVDAILKSLENKTGSPAKNTVELEPVAERNIKAEQIPASGENKKTYKEPSSGESTKAMPKEEKKSTKKQVNHLLDNIGD